jgi:anti-sigma factor RsiW
MEERPDIQGYLLGELSGEERKRVEKALLSDPTLQTQVEHWEALHLTLKSLPDEEPPRRISFVSDKVMEPPVWQRWLAAFSWPQAAMVSSCALALAIVGHGWMTRPVAAPMTTAPTVASPVATNATANTETAQVKQLRDRLAVLEASAWQNSPMQQTSADEKAVRASMIRSLDSKLTAMEQRLANQQKQDMDAVGQQLGLMRRDIGNSLRARNQEARLEVPAEGLTQ